ncbi:MAG: efflux RND transporter permease subunit [Candidatus Eremiobacteraeota bacterium]|nr:efflux RND transporter permease subunit [Candidatus Eremiobacteraeota bacterium]
MSISHLAIAHPRATIAFWAILSVAGIAAFFNLKVALFPDITFPVVIVSAKSNEIDVARNERALTNPLEAALKDLPGITRIHSLTYPQYAVVDMAFDVSESLAARSNEVRERLAAVALPHGVSTTISTLDLDETPVVTFALLAPGRSLAELARIAERDIAPQLRAAPGVLRADVVGGPATGSGASAYRVDWQPAVAIAVVKRASANTLDVSDACDAAIAALASAHPDLRIERTSEQATYIKEATRATQEALGIAVVLAVIVIWPFLRDLRATMISAIAIPVSLLGTACVMWLLRFNLETITLLALALVVGVIVDDAIVAVENIVRHLEAGEPPHEAAYRANKELGLTLVAASLTIVAVFLPIGLMQGTLGQFFRAFGITASAAILFSLLAARTLSPALAARWLRTRAQAPTAATPSSGRSGYRTVLRWALAHRPTVVAIAFGAFAAGLALIPFIPKGFIPHLDRGEFHVNFSTPLGTSLADTTVAAKTLERSVREDPVVSNVYTTIGLGPNQQNAGLMDVHLRRDRSVKTIDVENAARARMPSLDGVVATVADVPFVGSQTAKPLQFALLGDDLERLRSVGRDVQRRLQKTKGFVDVATSGLSDGTPFSAIEHVGGKRAVQITADLVPTLLIGDANAIVSAIARKDVPKGIALSFGGNSADAVTTFRDFGIALALSVVAIVVVLLLLFRNWIDPLVISVSLPLSIVGALFALWLTRAQFGMISLMAVIFLFGLVNKNAILLVDRIEKLRALGLRRGEAITQAGEQRLRPIVMTTAATILGMLPIALGFGAGAELRAPMAVAIIGGLVTSTLLSLIVIPVAYTLFDDWAGRKHGAA